MDTEKKFHLKKSLAIMLFVQMILTIILLLVSIYLLYFVIAHKLGGWMIASYILITISVISLITYSIIGYKKGKFAYILSVIPFLGAILVNILLPQRNVFQIIILSILFALTFAYLIRQENKKFTYAISLSMIAVALTFSIYSAITADVQFLGPVSDNWLTYVSMYLSIFIPTIMSTTFALIYKVRITKKQNIE